MFEVFKKIFEKAADAAAPAVQIIDKVTVFGYRRFRYHRGGNHAKAHRKTRTFSMKGPSARG